MSSLAVVDPKDIPDRLARHGRSQSELARYLNLDPSSLTKTIKGSRRMKADEMLKIDDFFGGRDTDVGAVETLSTRRRGGPRRIPVYGYAAAGGADILAFNSGQVIDFIDPPPLWNGTGDLVAIRVLGESMEPRLFEGEMVIAQIDLPPIKGSDCIIEMSDGTAVVKTYRGASSGSIDATQWNPGKSLQYDRNRVKGLHAVIWRR